MTASRAIAWLLFWLAVVLILVFGSLGLIGYFAVQAGWL